ncbi:hypothetical protein V6N11_033593 [Hibiscus sabdariffa]|uniref:RNase H type-1 domain-containing protein n=1 Tax=Hibiscus sabdariffa TaxID=183260 RepID=A0ABR2PYR0_9ROSI
MFCIRVSVTAFEDQRCWIDEIGTQENGSAMARNQGTWEEINKFEVLDSDIKAVELQVPNSFDNLSIVKLADTESGRGIQKTIPSTVDNSEAGLSQNGQSHVVLGGSERLVEIPIVQQSDSSKYSTESSEVQAPLLDKETGSHQVEPGEEIQAIVETSKALEIRFKGVLSWNVRGFGRKEKIKAARDLLAKVKPYVGFFQETKLEQVNENFSRKLWGNLNRCVVFLPTIRSTGGLISTWDPDFFNVSDRIINRRFIGLVGTLRDGNHSIDLVNVYGPSTDLEKKEFFEELSKLITKYNIAWVVGGDFNAYLNPEEKLGFSFNSFSMHVFKEFVGNMQGIDLPLCGGAFTWCNNRDPPTFVRLDRFIVTADVILKFPNISQVLLTKALSDHNAILIHSALFNWCLKPFKFFNYWLRKEGFDDLMTSVFSKLSSDGNSRGIGGLLREPKNAIKTWAKSQCQDRKVSIYNLEANINELEVKIQTSALPPSIMNQVLAVKRVLRVFELALGLGLNLKKSRVFGLIVDQASLQSWANAMGCSMGSLPTEYLGFPLGVRHNSIKLWELILKKLSTKLASWKSQLLSFGGLGRDWLQWIESSDGLYSIKTMKAQLSLVPTSVVNWKKVVWIGLAPPKVEAFMWLILHEHVPVKVELLKRGVSLVADDSCPLCNQARETVEHIFFTCSVSWQLWTSLVSCLGVSLVLHQNPLKFLIDWPYLCSKFSRDIMWLLIPFAIVWSIWLQMNEIIFHGKPRDSVQLVFNTKLRATWWWKALKTDLNIHLDSIIFDPSLASSFGVASPLSPAKWVWIPPPLGFLKFNVDGACSHEGKCGVGGVLRDANGSKLMEFSLSIGFGSPLLAEILAIKFAVERFVNSSWVNRSRLVVESDSKTIVDWVSDPSLSSPLFSKLVQGISSFFTNGQWSIRHIRRVQNVYADTLAKAEIG